MKAAAEELAAIEASAIALTFANTLDWHASEHPVETLLVYDDLVDWAVNKGAVEAQRGPELKALAHAAPGEAAEVLARGLLLREAIYDAIIAATRMEGVPAEALRTINFELQRAMSQVRIAPSDVGYAWAWEEAPALDAMLWPAARSVADLLTSPHLDRVRQCADERGCGYLFFDTSRNGGRRWCSMESCGNRAKARRHYARVRAVDSG